MTIPPIHGSGGTLPSLRLPPLTAPVSTGVPPIVGDDALQSPAGAQTPGVRAPAAPVRDEAPISLAGRLDAGDVLPDTTRLALALEAATRALQGGRADLILTELDAVWSRELAADSPWYLRTAALQLLGRTADAEQVLRDAIERLPRSAAMLYLLGVHTLQRGLPDASRVATDHALALHPTEPLLWLQRAALLQNEGLHGACAAILEHVRSLEPSFDAATWLSTLVRLASGSERAPTPALQRAIARLTPLASPTVLDEQATQPGYAAATAMPATALDAALRYGLTLLESPTRSARIATHADLSPEIPAVPGEVIASGAQPSVRDTVVLSWEAVVLSAAVIIVVAVPPLRIPALLLGGAILLVVMSRRLR